MLLGCGLPVVARLRLTQAEVRREGLVRAGTYAGWEGGA